jgi:hypothetical protein
LFDLAQGTRITAGVHVSLSANGARPRKFKSLNALLAAELNSPRFSLSVSADEDRSQRDAVVSPWVTGQMQFLTTNSLFSFFCEYLSAEQLAELIKNSSAFSELESGYGYVCEASSILVPDYYVAGIDILTPSQLDSISDFLGGRSPVAQWGKALGLADKPYLRNKFRDFYPGNIIGDEHVNALLHAGLLQSSDVVLEPIGRRLFWLSVKTGGIREEMRTSLVSRGLVLIPDSY